MYLHYKAKQMTTKIIDTYLPPLRWTQKDRKPSKSSRKSSPKSKAKSSRTSAWISSPSISANSLIKIYTWRWCLSTRSNVKPSNLTLRSVSSSWKKESNSVTKCVRPSILYIRSKNSIKFWRCRSIRALKV